MFEVSANSSELRADTIFSEDTHPLKPESLRETAGWTHHPKLHHITFPQLTSIRCKRNTQRNSLDTPLHCTFTQRSVVEGRVVGEVRGYPGWRHSPSGLFTRRSDTHCARARPALAPPARTIFGAKKSRISIRHRNHDVLAHSHISIRFISMRFSSL